MNKNTKIKNRWSILIDNSDTDALIMTKVKNLKIAKGELIGLKNRKIKEK